MLRNFFRKCVDECQHRFTNRELNFTIESDANLFLYDINDRLYLWSDFANTRRTKNDFHYCWIRKHANNTKRFCQFRQRRIEYNSWFENRRRRENERRKFTKRSTRTITKRMRQILREHVRISIFSTRMKRH